MGVIQKKKKTFLNQNILDFNIVLYNYTVTVMAAV